MEKTVKILSRSVCAAIALTALLLGYYYAALPVNISMDINELVPSGGFSAAVLRPSENGADYYVGAVPIKSAEPKLRNRPYLIPCGTPFGIKLKSDGVMVVSVAPDSPAENGGIKQGDIINEVNGVRVLCNTDITEQVTLSESTCDISLTRGDSELSVCCEPEGGHIGAWVRDSAAGIGTMTFIDPESGRFGGLGHAVNDVTTGEAVPLYSGEITRAEIYDVIKSESGEAGELCGALLADERTGTLLANTPVGVFGDLGAIPDAQPLPVAFRQEVKCGEATILATLSGSTPTEYSIEIERINLLDINGSKGMVIRITDERLLSEAGGIVRGMSGSPIIQNGMLAGAVTHVLVNDPTRGYAVFAESMTETLGALGS